MMKDFIIEDGILVAYRGDQENVIVPDSVTSIGNEAFKYCDNLQSVILPNSVISIGNYAFYKCISLISVIIPDSIKSIGYCAFEFCRSLKSIVIPDSVTRIGNYAFYGCTSLTNITIGNDVTRIGSCVFCWCTSLKSPKHNYKAFKLDEYGNLYSKKNSRQYKLNRTEQLDDEIKICKRGFHYCTNIFDIFNYYYGEYDKDVVIALCDVNEGNVQVHEENSKCCTDELTPIKLLTREEVIDLMNGKDIL